MRRTDYHHLMGIALTCMVTLLLLMGREVYVRGHAPFMIERPTRIIMPTPSITASPISQSPSFIVSPSPFPTPTLIPTLSIINYQLPLSPVPWGTTEKLAEHTYRTYVGEDPVMSTVDELHAAINAYRTKHGVGELQVHDGLCRVADHRIAELAALGGLDAHAGFKKYFESEDNWKNLGSIRGVGENNSAGYKQTGTHLIEWIFDADEEHRTNQLNPDWNRMCSRISGTIVEMVFGKE